MKKVDCGISNTTYFIDIKGYFCHILRTLTHSHSRSLMTPRKSKVRLLLPSPPPDSSNLSDHVEERSCVLLPSPLPRGTGGVLHSSTHAYIQPTPTIKYAGRVPQHS